MTDVTSAINFAATSLSKLISYTFSFALPVFHGHEIQVTFQLCVKIYLVIKLLTTPFGYFFWSFTLYAVPHLILEYFLLYFSYIPVCLFYFSCNSNTTSVVTHILPKTSNALSPYCTYCTSQTLSPYCTYCTLQILSPYCTYCTSQIFRFLLNSCALQLLLQSFYPA